MAALLADECIQETVEELMVSTKTFKKLKSIEKMEKALYTIPEQVY